MVVFPRCEMARLNAHEISAEDRFVCHFLGNTTQAVLSRFEFVSKHSPFVAEEYPNMREL